MIVINVIIVISNASFSLALGEEKLSFVGLGG